MSKTFEDWLKEPADAKSLVLYLQAECNNREDAVRLIARAFELGQGYGKTAQRERDAEKVQMLCIGSLRSETRDLIATAILADTGDEPFKT